MTRSMRLFLGGQVCETIDETTVLTTILDRFKPDARRTNDGMLAHPNLDKPLRPGRGRNIMLEMSFGLLKQQRWLPLHILSQLVVEMVSGDAADAFAEPKADWELRDVSPLGTCVHMDSSVTTQYHQHIDMGNKLTIPYTSVIGTRCIVASSDVSVALSRSLSRLNQV